MADIGMGGNIHQLQSTKTKNITPVREVKTDKAEKSEGKDAVRQREGMAGALQTESKHKKEEVTRSADKFKAHKYAYSYLLGEEPDDEEIEETLIAKKAAEEEEELIRKKELSKPTLEEIEKYNVREKFKSKVYEILGEDFDEDAPLDEEDEKEMTDEERLTDNLKKVELAKYSLETLTQYISESIGEFDFDNLTDLKLFLKYSMPEEAMTKLIIFYQIAYSDHEFPCVQDRSIILFKLNNIGINISDKKLLEILDKDFKTLKRLKYTIASFIYIPLQEIMDLIEEDLKKDFKNQFNNLIEYFNLEEFPDLTKKLSKSIMIRFRDIIYENHNSISLLLENAISKYEKLEKTNIKFQDPIRKEISEIEVQINHEKIKLEDIELKVAKFIYIYSFLNSQDKICKFNDNFPIDLIFYTLNLLKIRTNRKEIREFVNRKISIYSLYPKNVYKNIDIKRSSETAELKIKSAIMDTKKISPVKQQQLIRNAKKGDFDINNNLYWLKQLSIDNLFKKTEDFIKENIK